MSDRQHRKTYHAFTLAELLIALAILGVIAAFTIPKVLQAQQDGRNNAIAKETAAAVYSAYQIAKLKEGINTNTSVNLDILTKYLNYVSKDSTTVIDEWQTSGSRTCLAVQCFKMHNGAILWSDPGIFGGTSSTNAVTFWVDPDGHETDGTTNGPGKSVLFFLYYDGKIRTRGTTEPNTANSTQSWPTPLPQQDPPWFHWD